MTQIKPFIELSSFLAAQNLYKKRGFEITRSSMRKLKNGFIEVVVEWAGDLKYATSGGKMYSGNSVSQTVEFPVKFRFTTSRGKKTRMSTNLSFDVGLQTVTKKGEYSEVRLDYSPLFFQNLKYGVAVYFGPKGWDSIKERIADWSKDGNENLITRADWFRA
jgi:hypothetical protein